MIKVIGNSKKEETKVKEFLHIWKNDEKNIIQQTSGSTGKPKSIVISKWKMKASAEMTGQYLQLSKCKTALLCMDMQYIGAKMMVVRSLLYQLQLYVVPVNSLPLEHISFHIDFVAMVPYQVEKTLQHHPEKLNLITHLIIGGAPVSEHLRRALKDYSCNTYATFGMTETVSHIALKILKEKNAPYEATGNAIFTIQNDCLVIDSQELKINQLKTNDIVELVDDQHFFWKGRSDFIINSGGVKIHPEIVEQKIQHRFPHAHFIISSQPDVNWGEKVIFIGEFELQSLLNLNEEIEKIVNQYEKPKAYFFVKRLAKTASGKIDRIATRNSIL